MSERHHVTLKSKTRLNPSSNARFHIILVGRTVVTFSKFGGVTLGMFRLESLQRGPRTAGPPRQSNLWRSQKSAFFKHSLGEESGMRDKVIAAMDAELGAMRDRYGGGAWFLLTRILWAIQQELFVPTAKAPTPCPPRPCAPIVAHATGGVRHDRQHLGEVSGEGFESLWGGAHAPCV